MTISEEQVKKFIEKAKKDIYLYIKEGFEEKAFSEIDKQAEEVFGKELLKSTILNKNSNSNHSPAPTDKDFGDIRPCKDEKRSLRDAGLNNQKGCGKIRYDVSGKYKINDEEPMQLICGEIGGLCQECQEKEKEV